MRPRRSSRPTRRSSRPVRPNHFFFDEKPTPVEGAQVMPGGSRPLQSNYERRIQDLLSERGLAGFMIGLERVLLSYGDLGDPSLEQAREVIVRATREVEGLER